MGDSLDVGPVGIDSETASVVLPLGFVAALGFGDMWVSGTVGDEDGDELLAEATTVAGL